MERQLVGMFLVPRSLTGRISHERRIVYPKSPCLNHETMTLPGRVLALGAYFDLAKLNPKPNFIVAQAPVSDSGVSTVPINLHDCSASRASVATCTISVPSPLLTQSD